MNWSSITTEESFLHRLKTDGPPNYITSSSTVNPNSFYNKKTLHTGFTSNSRKTSPNSSLIPAAKATPRSSVYPCPANSHLRRVISSLCWRRFLQLHKLRRYMSITAKITSLFGGNNRHRIRFRSGWTMRRNIKLCILLTLKKACHKWTYLTSTLCCIYKKTRSQ